MAGRYDIYSRVVSQREVAPGTFLLRLHAAEICDSAMPGQFVMLRPTGDLEHDPLLRRPFSIHRIGREDQTLEILYRVTGRGTRLMSQAEKGTSFHLLGPLGRGFHLREGKIPVLVGGGMGAAPLLFLADSLKDGKAVIILGAITRRQLPRLDAFASTGLELVLSTEDGSLGNRGLVTEVLERLIGRLDPDSRRNLLVCACGPMPMMKAVSGLCDIHQVECQVSLEVSMACGLGLCLGCAVKGKGGRYLHVCKEGPVFSAGRVDWEMI